MSVPCIILDSLPSLRQKLSKLVEIWRSSDKNNFAQFFETRCRQRYRKWPDIQPPDLWDILLPRNDYTQDTEDRPYCSTWSAAAVWLASDDNTVSNANATVTCEIKWFQNHFRDLLQLTNIFQHVHCRWNNFKIILELIQRLK